MESRVTGSTRVQLVGNMLKKLINTTARKVRGYLSIKSTVALFIICFSYVFCVLSDYKEGFGGKFGVQKDRQDKSAVGWDHLEAKQQHDSQKGLSSPILKSLLCSVLSSFVALLRLQIWFWRQVWSPNR